MTASDDGPDPYRTPDDGGAIDDGDVRRRRRGGLPFILLTIFIDVLGIGIIIPVLPSLVKSLVGADEVIAGRYVGLIAATYAAMQFVFAPMLGRLSDRWGRRPVLIVSLIGLGIDFVIQGLANHIGWLIGGRLMAGAMGASITTANAYIADISDEKNRAANYGMVGVMFGLGFIAGPTLGGVLGDVHLRLPFFVAAGLAFANALYGYVVLPESLPPQKRAATSFSWSGLNPLSTLADLRRYPGVAGLAVVLATKGLAQRGLEVTWVLYATAKFGWSEMTNGLALGWVGLSALIVQGGVLRVFVRRFGERSALVVGMVCSALAFAAYAFATDGWMVWVIVPFGALGGLAGPSIQSLVTRRVDEDQQGRIQGALTSLLSLTSVAAPIVFTAGLYTYFSSPDAPVYFPGAPLLGGSILITAATLLSLRWITRHPTTD